MFNFKRLSVGSLLLAGLLSAFVGLGSLSVSAAPAPADAARNPGKVMVKVYDSAKGPGFPVANAASIVRDITGTATNKGLTDKDGMFAAKLMPGAYKLHIEHTGYFSADATFKVASGQVTKISVALVFNGAAASQNNPPVPSNKAMLSMRVLGKGSSVLNPIADAKVTIQSLTSAVIIRGRTDKSGAFSTPVVPGLYSVRVDAAKYAESISTVEVSPSGTSIMIEMIPSSTP